MAKSLDNPFLQPTSNYICRLNDSSVKFFWIWIRHVQSGSCKPIYLDICERVNQFMEKSHGKKMQKDLDVLESRINALEASTADGFQKSLLGVLKGMVQNQRHLIDESDHLRKAIDLITLQIFKVEGRLD